MKLNEVRRRAKTMFVINLTVTALINARLWRLPVGYFMIKTLFKEILCGKRRKNSNNNWQVRLAIMFGSLLAAGKQSDTQPLSRSAPARERDEVKVFSPKTNARGVLCEQSAVTLELTLKLQIKRLKKHIKP
ncbi:hypothetical protein GQX74_000824 [Glossina fuscipes]|nr:hypothetical protein GQX74_000824 [Glossina fuscipes]